jgi:hypothetical protein
MQALVFPQKHSYQSEFRTSPDARVPSARQVARLIELVMSLTEPSQSSTFTPLVWSLLGLTQNLRFAGKPQQVLLGGPQ